MPEHRRKFSPRFKAEAVGLPRARFNDEALCTSDAIDLDRLVELNVEASASRAC